jgi:MerR family transcriptional regulator, thiopeptide resistance regulator
MEYTVKQLSGLAGISVRTLHFYDEIGLLPPTRVGANGYRRYDDQAVLRLQQILFYKELGLSLEEIKAVLDAPGFDVLVALEAHRRTLQQRLGRLERLVLTVERTIAQLKGETPMNNQELFAGFSDAEQAAYEVEAAALWGEGVRESARRWKAHTPARREQIMADGQAIYTGLMGQMEAPADAQGVQAGVARWHQHLRHFFEPTVEAMRGLGQAYEGDPRFRAFFDKLKPGFGPFLHRAIDVYCDKLEQAA